MTRLEGTVWTYFFSRPTVKLLGFRLPGHQNHHTWFNHPVFTLFGNFKNQLDVVFEKIGHLVPPLKEKTCASEIHHSNFQTSVIDVIFEKLVSLKTFLFGESSLPNLRSRLLPWMRSQATSGSRAWELRSGRGSPGEGCQNIWTMTPVPEKWWKMTSKLEIPWNLLPLCFNTLQFLYEDWLVFESCKSGGSVETSDFMHVNVATFDLVQRWKSNEKKSQCRWQWKFHKDIVCGTCSVELGCCHDRSWIDELEDALLWPHICSCRGIVSV